MCKNVVLFIAISVCFFFSLIPEPEAQTLSKREFSQIQQKYREIDLAATLTAPDAFMMSLDLTVAENTYIKAKLLNKLALEKRPSIAQIRWVEDQLDSTQVLAIPDNHHHQQTLVITHIKNTAKMVISHWQAYSKQRLFEQRWETGTWSWSDYFNSLDRESTRAMGLWLEELSEEHLQFLVDSYLNKGIAFDNANNYLVRLLYEKSQSSTLLDKLWTRPVDSHSHHVLKAVSQNRKNLTHVLRAAEQPKLASQALLSLMKNYSGEPQVQAFIHESLQDKSLSKLSVATLSVIEDDRFRQQLLNYYRRQPESTLKHKVIEQLKGGGK